MIDNAEPQTAAPATRPNSDLLTRSLSAAAMMIVAGVAFWAGGVIWTAFVVIVGAGVYAEWSLLAAKFAYGPKRLAWLIGGAAYIGLAVVALAVMRGSVAGSVLLLGTLVAVIGTDVGAYALGRTLGGPRIAPKISPSKTWAGLLGGIIGATLAIFAASAMLATLWIERLLASQQNDTYFVVVRPIAGISGFVLAGAVVAVVAQAGDFFESWMKRRAGVKDSGALLPGHGGLFDRTDGLIAVVVFCALPLLSLSGGLFGSGQP